MRGAPKRRVPRGAACVAVLLAATRAEAARPTLTGEATFGAPGGEALVHYATSGGDAPLATDGNHDGVPDFVAEVATTAEAALQHFIALGFRRPLADGALGGDGRIDLYLRDLVSADGNAGIDACTGARCVGYIASENDFAGYSYGSLTEGIRAVVPHELFHLVQDAYASGQPASWTEGSAVWAVEHLYGAGNSDFERFLPAFITRSYRPFEREVGGFGDGYPYGAALWPYFLEQRYGVGAVVAAWRASEARAFLDACDAALADFDATTDAAWTEMTRWNAFTGSHAAGGGYGDASAWPEAPREPALTTAAPSATLYLEGMSARYVPVSVTERAELRVTSRAKLVAWTVAAGQGVEQGRELSAAVDARARVLEPGDYTLVITGLDRGAITTAVMLALGAPPPDDDGGGCTAARSSSRSSRAASALLVLAALAWTRRRATRS